MSYLLHHFKTRRVTFFRLLVLLLLVINCSIKINGDYIFPGIVSQRPDYVSCPYLDNVEQEEQRKMQLERQKAAQTSSVSASSSSTSHSGHTHNHSSGSYFPNIDENGYETVSSYGNNIQKQRHNSDGSISYINQSTCVICSGTKTCSACYGRGGRWSGYGLNKIWMSCGMCGGSGACRNCKGNGYTVHSSMYDPKSNCVISVGANGNLIVTSSDNMGTVSNYASPNEYKHSQEWHYGNDEPLCPDCKGSGKCHICQGDKIYYNSEVYKYLECSFCRSTGKCAMCHGRGSIR